MLHVFERDLPSVSARPARLPDADGMVVTPDTSIGRDAVSLEDQYFGIVYEDSDGFESTRAVIARKIKFNRDGIPLLCAFCCEREAYREFRMDRIVECWDAETGEYAEARAFLLEVIGFDKLALAAAEDVSLEKMEHVFAMIRPHVVLLGALSKCDHYMHKAEVTEIVRHVLSVADCMSLSDDEIKRVHTRVRRVRPSPDSVDAALDELRRRPPAQVVAFIAAAVAVVKADGKVKDDEIAMLDDLALELTGLGVEDLMPG
ncbi:TerB family tellurite resistance protein [Maricaulis maris]|uniref:Tellurite resistance protein TerB n=1 Tax=Maricaulis maris TaxID=74318 RepID=A0A495D1N6_9PROT|nr:TerB family tellurite resistance protein [Maricaulis maris]RKQ95454.1 tellurite resistance protein TerB [Maricaulis maris]